MLTACTATINDAECELDGLRVRVIDTPGVYDTAKDKDDIMTEIAKVSLCDIVLDIISKPVPIVNLLALVDE